MDNSSVSQLLTEVIDDMFEGFQIISRDFRYLYVNKTVALQGKKEKAELLGKTMMECYPGIENTPLFVDIQHCMMTKNSINRENLFDFPDGSKGCFSLYIHPIKEGVIILSIDISERKKAEKALCEKIEEIDSMTNATVEREVTMSDLKKEIDNLKKLITI
jgi:transcriptional regulator with PAS, ATPase and Fis domain